MIDAIEGICVWALVGVAGLAGLGALACVILDQMGSDPLGIKDICF